MKKIISYSLYNQRPKDVLNAVINCFLAKEIYEGWVCRFYIDDTIPESIRKALETFDNVEIVEMPRHEGSEAMLWRFLPASEEDVEVMISRDADSWLSFREYSCVEEFLKSDKQFHILRDHCYHSQKIMGGMWGVKNGFIKNMKELVDEFVKTNKYDQGFLAEQIYSKALESSMIHLGDQYDNRGNKTNGYYDDGGTQIPDYSLINRKIKNFPFEEAHALNSFHCAHCKKVHETFIGAILEKIPQQTLYYLKHYFQINKIDTSIVDSLL